MCTLTDSNMHSTRFDMFSDESLSKAAVVLMFSRLVAF